MKLDSDDVYVAIIMRLSSKFHSETQVSGHLRACLGVNPLGMPRTPYRAGVGNYSH